MNKDKELQGILKTMDVPEMRKKDYRWLNRNLGIQNGSNPQFPKAMDLIKNLLKEKKGSISDILRNAAGTIQTMKDLMEKDPEFKELINAPMGEWPPDKIKNLQDKIKKINEESRRNLR